MASDNDTTGDMTITDVTAGDSRMEPLGGAGALISHIAASLAVMIGSARVSTAIAGAGR